MAVSTCVKCSSHGFELALFTPLGESRKLTLVQCAQRGTPVGAVDPAPGPQIEALQNQVADIDERLQPDRKGAAGVIARTPFCGAVNPTGPRKARPDDRLRRTPPSWKMLCGSRSLLAPHGRALSPGRLIKGTLSLKGC